MVDFGATASIRRTEWAPREIGRRKPNHFIFEWCTLLLQVCYSWWVLASAKILGRDNWIDAPGLTKYILSCRDQEFGGFSDRPGNMTDIFHTLFAVAGLSLLGDSEHILPVNPVYCLSERTVERSIARIENNDK